ncbi:GrxC Glutaredoxin and related proteins [uncultured Caudovirales phage]|uniref:GrxC Glutaredoxin and related proteins n=1 Tax=uncultured Caudovirales phage TaxID=2100421 RepID=A0A6J5QUU8_9CAUD|nr:GrxC Glutaredoxin and related proteins [uncultured Caudovirales phage]CAB4212473.1 GrxC Glutaredoxin and related proteins [uncultured Caudovirales phage]
MTVTVYTRTTCGPCKTLKHWLKLKNIEFVEKNVEDEGLLDEMLRKTGMMSVPQTLVGDRVVTGPHFSLLSELLMV